MGRWRQQCGEGEEGAISEMCTLPAEVLLFEGMSEGGLERAQESVQAGGFGGAGDSHRGAGGEGEEGRDVEEHGIQDSESPIGERLEIGILGVEKVLVVGESRPWDTTE